MTLFSFSAGLPLQDLIVGALVYFPPLFKAVMVGFVIWLIAHRLLRDWMYSGEIWHPMLMDLSLFTLSVCLGLAVLTVW
ncbi:DUF1656 domain-containing protein [Enterobacter hormaechei]|uniref:DUF1656 domain-containing protein n=1 Tax=Enterobacter cloacae complex TaxID=354276 RepID=UPI0003BF58C8|nr:MULTISPECIES: DUF1656 domain-containing protein [Enterobacter cloacae complex]EHN8843062.1 DUF1656 domain-containing protein [Enterobacter hormaechei]ESM80093.1 hypothetical protein L384_02968 [Enterobacter sp. MGH 38]KAF6531512.1 DUF1656 domain-containing protein [Enterobacter hormaechei]KAF6531981.1 DUF1656 domain-containing protein [Enterobacter hormaechei]KTJ25977.1 hypothetical protein ASU88_18355 [Enterobacter hormaechei subsp. xiangfangensis]